MLWMICVVLSGSIVSVPVAMLVHRKMRQGRAAAALRIESAAGIAEEGFVRIGGIEQWISIRGEDRSNPVLLVLHGGPGSCYTMFTPHLRGWERHFTVVQWDQRGAGRTLRRMGERGCGEVSLEQLTRDAIEVGEYLRGRFEQEKVFLLASSIGSMIGLRVAHSRPDLLHAYIGTDQNVGMKWGRAENYRRLLEALRAQRMTRGAREVERIGMDATRWSAHDFEAVAQWTIKADARGHRRTMKLLKDAVWYAPGWTLGDLRGFVKGMRFSLERLLPDLVRFDAWAEGTRFECPFFILQGEEDVLTPAAEARAFFEDVDAPVKRMEVIAGAGHFAAFLQPEAFLGKLLRCRDQVA